MEAILSSQTKSKSGFINSFPEVMKALLAACLVTGIFSSSSPSRSRRSIDPPYNLARVARSLEPQSAPPRPRTPRYEMSPRYEEPEVQDSWLDEESVEAVEAPRSLSRYPAQERRSRQVERSGGTRGQRQVRSGHCRD